MITFRYLEIFDMVASCGKMSTAAKELFISQSAVSQAVTEIERQYSIQLFTRFKKRLILTPIGMEFQKYVHRVLLSVNTMEQWLQQTADNACIRIGGTGTVGASVLSPIIHQLQEKHPDLHVEITIGGTQRLERMLQDGVLDIALVGGKICSPDIVTIPAIRDRIVLFCGRNHPLWGKEAVTPEELQQQKLVLREESSNSRIFIMNALSQYDMPFTSAWTSYDSGAIKDLVANGFGISVLSERLIRHECEEGTLWAFEIMDHPLERYFSVIYHQNHVVSDTMRLFTDTCVRYGQDEEDVVTAQEDMEFTIDRQLPEQAQIEE